MSDLKDITQFGNFTDYSEYLLKRVDTVQHERDMLQAHTEILVTAMADIDLTVSGDSHKPIEDILKECKREVRILWDGKGVGP
jgi:hypothetical protein